MRPTWKPNPGGKTKITSSLAWRPANSGDKENSIDEIHVYTLFSFFFFGFLNFFLSEVVNTINKYCVFIQKLSLFESSQRNQSGGHIK